MNLCVSDKLKLVGTYSHHGLQVPRGDSGEGDCFDKCAVGQIRKKKKKENGNC